MTIFLFLIGLLKDNMNILLLLVSFRYVISQMVESRGILISFALFSVGVGALKFLQDPPQLEASHDGWSVDYNRTTDEQHKCKATKRSRQTIDEPNIFRVVQPGFFFLSFTGINVQ